MIAIQEFHRGTRQIQPGDTFSCTEQEARRYEARKNTVARRLDTNTIDAIRNESRARTLLIRAEQRRRNEEARKEKDLRRRKLASAGNRTKAESTVTTGNI